MSVALISGPGPIESGRRDGGLWRLLDPGFLAEAGWDSRREVLAPAPDHLLLGFRACRVLGCQDHALLPDQLCATCRGVYRRSDLSMEDSPLPGRRGPGAAARRSAQ